MNSHIDDITSNPLWDYSVVVYNLDGVPQSCLALQDTYGLDVNLLLYGAWLASAGRRLSHPHLLAVEAAVTDWRNKVVIPLRTLRRQWRSFPLAQALREEIKTLELVAEQQQQAMIYVYYQQATELAVSHYPLQENLELVVKSVISESDDWAPEVQRLIASLSA